jgi:hypothetical protein
VKARISCFGHGWACEVPGTTFYVGSFSEAVEKLDEVIGQYQIGACIDVYRQRMGQIQTVGNA